MITFRQRVERKGLVARLGAIRDEAARLELPGLVLNVENTIRQAVIEITLDEERRGWIKERSRPDARA